MRTILTALLLFTAVLSLNAQAQTDTSDIFFGHTDIGEATITGLTGRTRQQDSPVPISVVRGHELRHVPAANITDVIVRQPGMSQVTTGSGIAKPIIRGLGYNRIVCINDGVRQEGYQWGDEHGLEIDGGGLGSVEIIKGPASLMYGSDAMAGVLIFRPTALPEEGTFRSEAETEYQTNSGLWRYSLSSAGRKHGFVWDARWSQQAAHAYKNRADGYVPGTQHRSHAARALLGLDKGWGHSFLTLSYYHLTPSIAEGEREEETGELERPDGWSGKSYGYSLPFQRVDHYKAVSETSVGIGAGTLTAILGYQQNRRREYEESRDECGLSLRQHTLTYDVRYLMPLGSSWKFTGGIGGMYQHSDNLGEEFLIPDYRLFDFGFFATASREVGRFSLSGGLRYDRRHLSSDALEEEEALRFAALSRNFNGLSASLGAVWHARRNLNVRLNVARGFRAPTIAEMASNGIHEGAVRYEMGNSRLSHEDSWQADLGADYTDRILSVQAALFANRINNYIYVRRTDEVADEHPVYTYDSGNARLLGFEVGLDIHPVHSLHFQNTFSYVSAVQLHQPADTRHLPLTPAPHWRSELKWELAHGHKPHAFGLDNAYLSLAMDCHLCQSDCYRADGTETPTPSYTLLSLAFGTDVVMNGKTVADILLCADNLTDRNYQPHLSRLKYTDGGGLHAPGRNFTIKLRLPLNFH